MPTSAASDSWSPPDHKMQAYADCPNCVGFIGLQGSVLRNHASTKLRQKAFGSMHSHIPSHPEDQLHV